MARLDVNRWQQSRPHWNYNPTMQFWFRFVMITLRDALRNENGVPTDEALLARDWFARSAPEISIDGRRKFVSFDECCHWLGLNVEAERLAILEMIDKAADFDTDECFARLEILNAAELDESEPIFEIPPDFRIVAVRDQGNLFACGWVN